MQQYMDDYQKYIHKSRYARWLDKEQRRETWEETVSRYVDFFRNRSKEHEWKVREEDFQEIHDAILNLEVMPSMRALMTAGPALERDHTAAYNCAFIAIDRVFKLPELMHCLLCGTGVGFSVERQFVQELPPVPEELYKTKTVLHVEDSKDGWCRSFKELLGLLFTGQIPKWDLSEIRPAGARLVTFGGRASGPEPLAELFEFCVDLFKGAVGRKFSSIEVHDLCCKVADVVVVGGVRRSALISLSNLSDLRMREAKSGEWGRDSAYRSYANNSVAYTEKPDECIFFDEWKALMASRSGERGIFARYAAKKHVENNTRRNSNYDFGTNPCSEIILRDRQFCNLTEVVVRPDDTFVDLQRKVRIAAVMGTFQSSLTNFKFLSHKWTENCEEERLLGVSLTGIMDHPVLSSTKEDGYAQSVRQLESWLTTLKEDAVASNAQTAEKIGINPSRAITCVKPSGTVSQLVDSSSGIHPRFSRNYVRTVRGDKKDPVSQFMIDNGVPCEQDYQKESHWVFSFPRETPEMSVSVADVSAIEQLELWKTYATYWCEHKPSCTVYIKEGEWLKVGAWVYENFDLLSGISFLPYSDHVYRQAPYQEIDKEAYDQMQQDFPSSIDWSRLASYEHEDNTEGSQEFACVGGACEII